MIDHKISFISSEAQKILILFSQVRHPYIQYIFFNLQIFFQIEGHSIDRKTFLQQEVDGSYTVKRTLSRGDAPPKEFIQSYSAESMQGFLSEGSNILLQRMMALKKVENFNHMTFLSFDAECNLCQCTYVSSYSYSGLSEYYLVSSERCGQIQT